MLYILHTTSSLILTASPKQLCYHLVAQRRKPRLRIVGTVHGTQLVRDRAVLLASPPGAVGTSGGLAGGSPRQLPACTPGFRTEQFNSILLEV